MNFSIVPAKVQDQSTASALIAVLYFAEYNQQIDEVFKSQPFLETSDLPDYAANLRYDSNLTCLNVSNLKGFYFPGITEILWEIYFKICQIQLPNKIEINTSTQNSENMLESQTLTIQIVQETFGNIPVSFFE